MSLFQYKTKNYYAVLNVPETATAEEIKKAFFHLARLFHPDTNHEPGAADKFKEVNEAYQVLGNEQERAVYDKVRHASKISSDHFSKTNTSPGSSTQTQSQTAGTAASSAQPKKGFASDIEHYRRQLIVAAVARIAVLMLCLLLIGYLYILLIEVIEWGKTSFTLKDLRDSTAKFISLLSRPDFWLNARSITGLLAGGIIGLILGIDLNFKIESFFTSLRMKKIYHILRTLLFTFATGFLFLMAGVLVEKLANQSFFSLKIIFMVLGLLLGSTISSDGNFVVRLKSFDGLKALVFIFFRNFGFGLIGGVLGALLALIIFQAMPDGQLFLYMPLTGFALFTALGSTSEEEVATMVQSFDRATIKLVFLGILIGVLVVGIAAGFFIGKSI